MDQMVQGGLHHIQAFCSGFAGRENLFICCIRIKNWWQQIFGIQTEVMHSILIFASCMLHGKSRILKFSLSAFHVNRASWDLMPFVGEVGRLFWTESEAKFGPKTCSSSSLPLSCILSIQGVTLGLLSRSGMSGPSHCWMPNSWCFNVKRDLKTIYFKSAFCSNVSHLMELQPYDSTCLKSGPVDPAHVPDLSLYSGSS